MFINPEALIEGVFDVAELGEDVLVSWNRAGQECRLDERGGEIGVEADLMLVKNRCLHYLYIPSIDYGE